MTVVSLLLSCVWISSFPSWWVPPKVFLQRIKCAVSGFSRPPRHHVTPSSDPQPLLRDLLTVFVCDDTSKLLLALLYRGPFKALQRCEKFIVLQMGDKPDSVSVDKLKPVISSIPVISAVPSLWGCLCLLPASVTLPQDPLCLQEKKNWFSFRFQLWSSAKILVRWFKVLCLSRPSSGFAFWGEYL